MSAEAVAAALLLLHHRGGQRRVQAQEAERGGQTVADPGDCQARGKQTIQSLFDKCKTLRDKQYVKQYL